MARAWNVKPLEVRARRKELGVSAVFTASTPARRNLKVSPRISIRATNRNVRGAVESQEGDDFSSGPNRIGQGIEFDYCCCHASFALQNTASNRSW